MKALISNPSTEKKKKEAVSEEYLLLQHSDIRNTVTCPNSKNGLREVK
jgi:hypothetical protein